MVRTILNVIQSEVGSPEKFSWPYGILLYSILNRSKILSSALLKWLIGYLDFLIFCHSTSLTVGIETPIENQNYS